MLIGLTNPSHHCTPRLQQPRLPQVQPPMVYVYETQQWEYTAVVRDAAEKELPSERELNELGRNGWELVGVLALSGRVQFYFKRIRK